MDKNWAEKTTLEKVASVVSWVSFGAWILIEVLTRTNVVTGMEKISYVAIIALCLGEIVLNWNIKRVISYIGLAGVACMICVIVLEIFLVTN